MSVPENISLMKRWFREVWNEGNTKTVHELLAPDGVARGQSDPHGEIHGPDEFLAFVESIRASFSEIHTVIEDVFGAEDKVVVRWSATMTHSGAGLGVPASGKRIRVSGITIARIRNGQVVEGWDNWDQLSMLRQTGVYREAPPLTAKIA